jgi:hypothetical protein
MLGVSMNAFGVLTNRKRALIALIHTLVFLGVALHGFAAPKAGILHGTAPTSDFVLVMVYLTVASILAWLVSISRCAGERLYFVLCASSATFGLLRTGFGDSAVPAAQYLRVIMLTSAIFVGTWIFRSFARPAAEGSLSD